MRDTGLRFVNFLLHFTVVLCLALACRAQGASNIPNTISIQASGAPSGACGNNFVYTNSATNDFYNCVAGTWNKVSSAGGAGTVTSVICGSGLSGGTITTTGTCALATSAVGSAGMILLEEHTAATSAELDFTTCISATYDTYQLEAVNLIPATTNVRAQIQFSSNGGSSYDTGSHYQWFDIAYDSSVSAQGSASDTSAQIPYTATITNTASDGGISATYKIHNPGSGASNPVTLDGAADYTIAGSLAGGPFKGAWSNAAAANAFRIKMSSGNITSGTVRCYGLTK